MLYNFIALLSMAHPHTHYLVTGSDGGPSSTFGWGGVRKQTNAVEKYLCDVMMLAIEFYSVLQACLL